MGSSSAGAQTVGIGLSFGSTWTDDNCVVLEQVRTVAVVLADPDTAEAMMCALPTYRAARASIGRPC